MTDTATIAKAAPEGSTDERIDQALLALATSGEPMNHDEVARLSGVSRRTVYRRYADQPALRARLWQLLSPPGGMPRNLDDLLDWELRQTFEKFDLQAAAMVVETASAEGRQMRLENRAERIAAYDRIFAPYTARLTPEQRNRANAAMQLLCCGLAWREMRDQWGLEGADAAQTSVWAIRVLLAHLEREGAAAFAIEEAG